MSADHKLRRRRIVIEVMVNEDITEGATRRMIEALFKPTPGELRRHGVLPSSVKIKQYSKVVAAEFGQITIYGETDET